MNKYRIGNSELDTRISQLVEEAGEGQHPDLIGEIITTALKLHQEEVQRGDLKMMNNVLKEMRWTSRVFNRHPEPKVTIFGSARLPEHDSNYQIAQQFAQLMAEHGWGVVTGAGPGIMEAGNRGAGPEQSFGVNIMLPFESGANSYLLPERTINYKYFFTRKLGFIKEAHAFALLPGGVGTLDETYELLTLLQTGKSDMHPVVLLDAPGTNYWSRIISFMEDMLLAERMIGPADMSLFVHLTDPDMAAQHILRFYSNYHSHRYVGEQLVIRMRQGPTSEQLNQLNRDFTGLLVSGEIVNTDPLPAEVADGDALECHRLALRFDRRQFGRLREMIDRINLWVGIQADVRPPPAFTEEQQERPW